MVTILTFGFTTTQTKLLILFSRHPKCWGTCPRICEKFIYLFQTHKWPLANALAGIWTCPTLKSKPEITSFNENGWSTWGFVDLVMSARAQSLAYIHQCLFQNHPLIKPTDMLKRTEFSNSPYLPNRCWIKSNRMLLYRRLNNCLLMWVSPSR